MTANGRATTIDLTELLAYTRATGQPTEPALLDPEPLRQFTSIEITAEHVTVTYNESVRRFYNASEITHREWSYKYNDDRAFVSAIAKVVGLVRDHLRDLPENLACPPGCGECCRSYEPFVSREDVQRIADHFGIAYREALRRYVNERPSADGSSVGWLKKTGPELSDPCVFLEGGRSGRFTCGIYEARPHDCREFSPIGCENVDIPLWEREKERRKKARAKGRKSPR
ncbi:MAG TPA: YkgJ family cysteine cluster protein [Candidatus Dormibacteraeota bacterium]|nr:YkgJ family cysteine cluster protein [Candidatus Dormibacteraeota bacterium]